MADIFYPDSFRDKMRRLFRGTVSEPEIILDRHQLLSLFQQSDICKELRRLKPGSDMSEISENYGADGLLQSITFRLFNKQERARKD